MKNNKVTRTQTASRGKESRQKKLRDNTDPSEHLAATLSLEIKFDLLFLFDGHRGNLRLLSSPRLARRPW
jgi:hypothetical protein